MRELSMNEIEQVSGGWSDDNNNLFSVVVRNAGFGMIGGGALGGPKGALVGGVIGTFHGINSYYGYF